MKFISLLILMFITVISQSQSNDTTLFLSSSYLGVIKNSLGKDSVTIFPLKFPDTIGMKNSVEREKKVEYYKFRRIQRFNLDSCGQVQNYHMWIFCPVGEIIPTLLDFKIQKNQVFMTIKYEMWDKPDQCWQKYFVYNIKEFTLDRLDIYKVKETTVNCP